ncbi:pre-mRNA cleavage complex 2 protein Pcf11 [Centruroides vittatus]|uniref:pre-mRNA cleavage complex 2 protein Pcf11 n=1 Tax=Centruroides vittatus TaxID=120091 RepID=UPI003510B7B2
MNSNMEEDNINEEYRSSLADLTCNSKPLISMLTMLAEDNLENAREIVKVIESHLQKVGPEIKLPVMYLIDSIVKNVGRQYLNLFTQSIVSNFCSVFEKVDEKTRMQLFKLRQTWNGIFPNKKLYAIDARVNAIDPAWPITAEKPPQQTIHVNPKFFENKQSPQPTKIIPENEVKSQEELQEEVRKQLWAKQQELLKLQQQKLELELMQTKAKLEEQTRLLNMHDKEVRSVDPRLTRLDPRISLRDPRLHKMTPGTTASPIGQNSTPTGMSFGNRQRIGTELQNPQSNQMNFTNTSHTPNSQMKLGSSHSVLPSFPAKSELNNNSNNNNVLTKIVSSSTENSVSQCTNGNKNMNSQSLSEGKSNIPKHSVTNLRTSENSKISGKKVKKDDSQDVKNNEDMSKKNISPKKVSSGKKNTSTKKMKNFEHDDDKLSREKKEISQNKANINKSVIKEKDRVNENEISNIQHSEPKTRKRRNLDKMAKNNWEAEENSRRDNSKVHRSTKSQSKVIKSDENEQTRKVSERERSRSPLKKTEKHSKRSDNVRSNNQESSNKSKLNQEVKNRVSESNVIMKKSDSCTKDQTTRDIDLRLLSGNTEKLSHEGHKSVSKRELDQKLLKDEESKENEEEPPIKKAKEGRLDNLFGIQDQDYRQISQMSDINLDKNVKQKGWAQYKAIHPDEFKSPLRPSRENMDGSIDKMSEREQEERFDFHVGDPRMYGYDSLGRPRRSRMRNDRFFKQSSFDRFKSHYNQFGRDQQQVKAQMELMLANEKEILRQAEQQLHSGRMTNEQYEDLRAQLENLYDRKRLDDFQSLPKKNFARFNIPDKEFLNERYDKTSRRTDFINDKRPQGNFTVKDDSDDVMQEEKTRRVIKEEKLKDQSSLPPVRSIVIDKQLRKIHFVGQTGVIMMENDDPREISFKGAPKKVFIDDMEPLLLGFGGEVKEFEIEGKKHTIKFGAPSRELYIDDYPYEARFGGPSIKLFLDDAVHTIHLEGPPPNVQISEESRKDLLKDLAFLNDKQGKDLASSGSESKKVNNVKGESNKIESSDSKTDSQQSNSNNSVVNKDVDLRSEKQKKSDSNKDQDFRKSDSLVEDISHDIDMRSVAEKEENMIEKNLSINQDLQNNRESSKEEVPVSSFKDIDWRPVLLTAESSSPNRSPSTREHSEQNEEKRHTHLDEKEFTQQPVDKTRMQNSPVSSVKRLVNERYPTTVHSSYRDSPPYWNQERMWDNPSRIETSVASSVKKDDRDVTMSSRHIEWDSQEHGQWDWNEPSQYGKGVMERRPVLRENRWTEYPHPPKPLMGPRRDDPLPPHSTHPVPGKPPYGKDQWISASQINRNSLWPDRRHASDGWDWRDDFKRGPRCLPFRPNWESPPHHEEYPTYYREGPPPPPPPRPPPGPPPRPPYHNIPRFPVRGSSPLREQIGFGLHRRLGPRQLIRLHQDNFPRPMLMGNPDMPAPPSVLRANLNQHSSSLGLGPPLPSYPQQFPTSGQRFNTESSQEVPYEAIASNKNETVNIAEAISIQPKTEVSNSTTFTNALPPLDVQTLFEKLVAAGIIPESKTSNSEESGDKNKSTEEKEVKEPASEEKIPPIEFTNESLKARYNGVITALYRGAQCASCGLRFTEGQHERYSQHLDWHFRVNRREKDGAKKAFSRKWFYDVEDWIQFEEIEDLEERARSFFELQADEEQFQIADQTEIPSVPAADNEEKNSCVVCREHFEQFWVEEEEEWHLKYAIRVDDQPYHPLCYEDFKKASEAPETPVEVHKTDPLAAAISVENIKKEIDNDSIEKEIKEEPKDEEDEEESKETTEKDDSVIDTQPIDQDTISDEKETTSVEVVIKEEPLDNEKEEDVEKEQNEESVSEEIKVDETSIEEETPNDIPVMELCNLTSEATLEEEEIRPEAKKIILKSGGIVMKVRADSIALPASPNSNAKPPTTESTECEEIKEMEYPPPDPRFKVLPPVQRGKELSGLCSIM